MVGWQKHLKTKLPVKKIQVWDENGRLYKKAKQWKVKNGFPIYKIKIWGYSENKISWQIDGRHIH